MSNNAEMDIIKEHIRALNHREARSLIYSAESKTEVNKDSMRPIMKSVLMETWNAYLSSQNN